MDQPVNVTSFDLFAISVRIGNEMPPGETHSMGLWDQPNSWVKFLPNCRLVGSMADREICLADLASMDAIRHKARFLLDMLLVYLGCWNPVPEITHQRFSRATDQGQGLSDACAPPSPLILISHGLAGVVLKEAVVLASQERQYFPIFQRICRLVFCGCPHSTDPGAWGMILYNVGMAYSKYEGVDDSQRADILYAMISLDKSAFAQVSASFLLVAGTFDIISYYEDTSLDTILVAKSSATIGLPNENQQPLQKSHQALCTSDCNEDDLEIFTTHICFSPGAEYTNRNDLDRTRFYHTILSLDSSFDLLQRSYHPRYPSTCSWITDNAVYAEWLVDGGAPILHLHGEMGCGKSTLLGYLAEVLSVHQFTSRGDTITVRFTFEKIPSGYLSLRGLLLAFIRKFLVRQPELVKVPSQSADADGLAWTTSVLWNIFISILLNPARKDVICLIDDMDNSDNSIEMFLNHVTAAIDDWNVTNVPERLGMFKAIVTSRNCGRERPKGTWKIIPTSHNCIKLRGETGIENDKHVIVRSWVLRIVKQRPALTAFEASLCEKLGATNVTILQAVVNLKLLELRGLGGTMEDMEKNILLFPKLLEDCYHSVLGQVPKTLQTPVTQVLSWILHAARPLSTTELGTALAINPDEQPPFDNSLTRMDIGEIIEIALSPLVTITQGRVDFFHPSARRSIFTRFTMPRKNNPWAIETFTHATATRCCLAYMRWVLSQLNEGGLETVQYTHQGVPFLPLLTTKSQQYSFLEYSITNWTNHYLASEGSADVKAEVLNILQNEPATFNLWYSMCRVLQMPILADDRCWRSHTLLLCELGLVRTLEALTDKYSYADEGKELATALHIAAEEGRIEVIRWILRRDIAHEAIVQELMRVSRRKIIDNVLPTLLAHVLASCKEAIDESVYRTLLCAACEQGHSQAVQILWQQTTLRTQLLKTKLPYTESSKPLRYAAAIGHQVIIQILLGAPRFRGLLNPPVDRDEITPLHVASQNGHLNIVEILIARGANRNSLTPVSSRNALHLACIAGYPEIVSYLASIIIRGSRPGTDGMSCLVLKDQDQRTAMHFAAHLGGAAVIRVLLNCGQGWLADELDATNMSPLHFAAQAQEKRGLEMLLKLDSETFCERGGRERMTPLHYAVRAGSVECVKLLMSNMYAPDIINYKDIEGNSPLHTAAKLGAMAPATSARSGKTYLDIIKILLANSLSGGTYVFERTGYGWTVLHLAHHNPALVKLLIDEGANKMATTPQGWTALALSAKGGYVKVVRLLLDAGAQMNHHDKDGYTPLHWAAQNGHTEVIEELLYKYANPMLKIQAAAESSHPCDGTAFHLAYTNKQFSAFEVLLGRTLGSDPTKLIFRAIERGETELARALPLYQWSGRNYLINTQDEHGRTALFYAVAWGHTEIAVSLLNAGVDTGVQDNDGRVAADVVNSRELLELFIPSNPGASTASADIEASPVEPSECPNLNFKSSALGSGLANACRCSFKDCKSEAVEVLNQNPEFKRIVGFFYHCCDCIVYRHGIIICQHCFDKGKRCQDVPRLRKKSVTCTYKVRFLKNGLVSFSEFCDWTKDLKLPHQNIRRHSPYAELTEAPQRGDNDLDLQMGHSSGMPIMLNAPIEDTGISLAEALGSDHSLARTAHVVGASGTKRRLDIPPEATRRSKRLQQTPER
ncbi:hypothetical protein EV426DRAFT_380340 [Tirmania nivea]|nr:hypothetical protein EV426DRAFT_380340 [Tirmania nivea]